MRLQPFKGVALIDRLMRWPLGYMVDNRLPRAVPFLLTNKNRQDYSAHGMITHECRQTRLALCWPNRCRMGITAQTRWFFIASLIARPTILLTEAALIQP